MLKRIIFISLLSYGAPGAGALHACLENDSDSRSRTVTSFPPARGDVSDIVVSQVPSDVPASITPTQHLSVNTAWALATHKVYAGNKALKKASEAMESMCWYGESLPSLNPMLPVSHMVDTVQTASRALEAAYALSEHTGMSEEERELMGQRSAVIYNLSQIFIMSSLSPY